MLSLKGIFNGRDNYRLLDNTRLFKYRVFLIVETIKTLTINSKNIPYITIISFFLPSYNHVSILQRLRVIVKPFVTHSNDVLSLLFFFLPCQQLFLISTGKRPLLTTIVCMYMLILCM